MTEKKDEEKAPQKIYSYQDLLKFENSEIYSSFGKMRISNRQSAPKYGFGTADRNKQQKVFQNKDLAKTEFWGKDSPGPTYDTRGTDQFPAKWKIGEEKRNTLNTGAKYDYYGRQDIEFFPNDADKVRRPKSPTMKMGLESRFPNEPKRFKGTPGPQYNPSLRHEIPNSQKFSFGFRRQNGQSPLFASGSTPLLVGPGSYIPKDVPKTSKIELEPTWSFPKGPQRQGLNPTWDKNQTFDTKSRAIGVQQKSQKKTLPAYSFGKSSRDAKTGTFKDMMSTQPTKVRIDHPKI